MLYLMFIAGCKPQQAKVNYTLSDEQLSRLMFDVQLSDVALSEVEGQQQDSLKALLWLRLTEVYKQTVPELEDQIRKLEIDPEKMKHIMDQVQVLSDSIH